MKKKYVALVLGLAISMTGTSVYAADSSVKPATETTAEDSSSDR